jgi:hypothetical protein
MYRSIKNTAAVMIATALTALAVFAGVQVAGLAVGAGTATTTTGATTGYYTTASNVAQSTSSGGTTLTCPRTGCTASTCHATTGLPPGQ